jgi:hypothetical protein
VSGPLTEYGAWARLSPERRENFEPGEETRELSGSLIRMRPEYFLVGDPASSQLVKRLHCGAAITGVGEGGDSMTPAIPDALPRRSEKICRRALGLERDHPANPRGEIILRHLAVESGELEVGVGIDQTRQERDRGEL